MSLVLTPAERQSSLRTLHRIALLALEPVVMKTKRGEETLNPIPLLKVVFGESVFREFICTPGCFRCCWIDSTLDYAPTETAWLKVDPEVQTSFDSLPVTINGVERIIRTRQDRKEADRPCTYLQTGRTDVDEVTGCALWPNHPLECYAAPVVHVVGVSNMPGVTRIQKKPYGRAWRYDPPLQCQFVVHDKVREALNYDLRVWLRYQEWADYFQVRTMIPEIVKFITACIQTDQVLGRFEIAVGV